ncbi:MAG: EamA/RhaT family transporter [Hyphomicrobium sp.]|nr:EamA/RhaT family transporter [Hyphomicrobium sp.]PPC80878.1 MAG: EamA family transporter [Hyphomicrobium sp.]
MSEPPIPAAGTTETSTGADRADRLRAILLMVAALVMFSGLDTTAKYLVTHTPISVAQLSWLRFLGQFVLLLTLVPALGLLTTRELFTTRRLGWQLVRSVLMAATTVLNFLALQYLRLDQTITIVFLAPLVVALLAGPLLGEWVGWRRMLAILVGFGGILIAVRPGFAEVHPAVIYSFVGMLAYALFMILTRRIAAYDPPLVTLFYSMFVGTIFGAPIALSDWVWPPDWVTWLMLLSLGVLGGTGHYLFILAYRLAPASTIAPFLYLQLLSMVGFGWFVFGDVPDGWTLAGAAVVTASGIYLVHREHVLHRQRST